MAKRSAKTAVVKAKMGDAEVSASEELAIFFAEGRMKRQQEWREFLALNPTVVEFPESRRFRSVADVERLKRPPNPLVDRMVDLINGKIDALSSASCS